MGASGISVQMGRSRGDRMWVLGSDSRGLEIDKGYISLATQTSGSYSMTRLAANKYPDVTDAADWWPNPELQTDYVGTCSLLETSGLFQPHACSLAPQRGQSSCTR